MSNDGKPPLPPGSSGKESLSIQHGSAVDMHKVGSASSIGTHKSSSSMYRPKSHDVLLGLDDMRLEPVNRTQLPAAISENGMMKGVDLNRSVYI